MSVVDDLRDDELMAIFHSDPECVEHPDYISDPTRGVRRQLVIKRWIPQKPFLGAGAFGTVRLELLAGGPNAASESRAVKMLDKMQMSRTRIDFRKELSALSKFSKPKFSQQQVFVKFFGWFQNESHIFIAMEYFPLGSLDRFMEGVPFREPEVKGIAMQLLEGLKTMHEENFTHRDLKPQNIFVVSASPDWWVKIGDFGISKRVSSNDTALQTQTGTPHYLAPEVRHYVRDAGIESGTYTNAVDIWSFACVVYQLLAGKLPFPRGAVDLIPYCDGGAFPDGPLEPHSSLMGINFIKSVLVPRPQLRLSAVNALEAPWLSTGTKGKGIQQGTKTAFDFKMLSSHLAEISKAQSSHSGDTVFSDLDPFTYVSKSSTGLYSSGISPAGGSNPAVFNNEKQINIDGVTIASHNPFWRNQHDINPSAPGPMPEASFEPNLDTDIYGVTGNLNNPFRKSQIGVSPASLDTPQEESRSRPYSMVPNRRLFSTNPPNRSYDIQPTIRAESPVGQNDWGRDDVGFGSSSTTRTQDSGYRSAPGPRENENFRGGFDPQSLSRRTADWMTDDEWEENYENQGRGNIRWDNRERRPVPMRSSGEERGREMLIKVAGWGDIPKDLSGKKDTKYLSYYAHLTCSRDGPEGPGTRSRTKPGKIVTPKIWSSAGGSLMFPPVSFKLKRITRDHIIYLSVIQVNTITYQETLVGSAFFTPGQELHSSDQVIGSVQRKHIRLTRPGITPFQRGTAEGVGYLALEYFWELEDRRRGESEHSALLRARGLR